MAELDEIMNHFNQIAAANQELRLVNEYKGIPVSYGARITEVGRSSIRVKTEKYQIVCLYRERFTFIQALPLPRNVSARVMLLDVGKMEALLSKFVYTNPGMGERRQVRVEPETTITGFVTSDNTPLPIQGELADLSQDGLGVYIRQSDYSPQYHVRGNPVRVYMQLPISHHSAPKKIDLIPLPNFDIPARYDTFSPVSFENKGEEPGRPSLEISSSNIETHSHEIIAHGTIVNIKSEISNRRHRLGILLQQRDPSRAIINRFISRRQLELTREIKTIYEMLSIDQPGIIT